VFCILRLLALLALIRGLGCLSLFVSVRYTVFSLPDGILLVSHWAKHMPRLYSFVTVVGYWNDDVVECFKGGSSGVG